MLVPYDPWPEYRPQSREERVIVNPSLKETHHKWHIHSFLLPFSCIDRSVSLSVTEVTVWCRSRMSHLEAFLLLSPFSGHGVWLFELIIPPLVSACPNLSPPSPYLTTGFHLLFLTSGLKRAEQETKAAFLAWVCLGDSNCVSG